jgi:hypothetical protein
MKWRQIAFAIDGDGEETLYALSAAGDLFCKKAKYDYVPDGLAPRKAWRYWWEEVDFPIGDPALLPAPQHPLEIRHLFTDEEVAGMKAKGLISTEPIPVPASTPGVCVHCGNPTGDPTSQCNDCAIPF